VQNALLFLIKSLIISFKVHKNPGNLLTASCVHWLLIVGVLFVAVVWVLLLVELFCSVCVMIVRVPTPEDGCMRLKCVVEEYTQDKYKNKNVAFRTVITHTED
jgi:hypothetical protein